MTFRSVPAILGLGLLISPLFADQNNNPTYLALGDSIVFGYNPLVPLTNPDNFIGYPELIADAKHVQHVKKEINAGCPGETSASFLDIRAMDAGCNNSVPDEQGRYDSSKGYKDGLPLHVAYQESQLEFAKATLLREKQISLVTLSLGGNDLILVQRGCRYEASCIMNKLPAVLAAYAKNLTTILNVLRNEAGYTGKIVLLTYYSPDYRDPIQTAAVTALNSVIMQVAKAQGLNTEVAEGFEAFKIAAAPAGWDPCAAGLLINVNGTCDVHPSAKGAQVLADAILNVIGKNKK